MRRPWSWLVLLALGSCTSPPPEQCELMEVRPAIDGCNTCHCVTDGWGVTGKSCQLELALEGNVACYSKRAVDTDREQDGVQPECWIELEVPEEPSRFVARCDGDMGTLAVPANAEWCWYPRPAEADACVETGAESGLPAIELEFLGALPSADGARVLAWCQAYLPEVEGGMCARPDAAW